jgi:FkbM family methyltransferase
MGRLPKRAILRSGRSLVLDKKSAVHAVMANLFGLELLQEENWTIKVVENADAASDCLNISSQQDGVEIKCRLNNGTDIFHLTEIFIDKHYGYQFDGKIVVDVGMSNGDSAIYFAKRGAKMVLGLEPSPESFSIALENIKRNKLEDRIIPLNLAMSSKSESTKLFISSRETNGDHLALGGYAQSLAYDSVVSIEAITLGDLLQKFKLNKVDILKMDCEGCENDVVRSLDASDFKKLDEVILELHGSPEPLLKTFASNSFQSKLEFGSNLRAKMIDQKLKS